MATTITSSTPVYSGGSLPAFDPSKMPPPGQSADFADSLTVVSTDASAERASMQDLMTLFGMMLKQKSDDDKEETTAAGHAADAAKSQAATKARD